MTNHKSHNYDDIIRLPHHVSRNHPPMPLMNRAAQFSPFAALTGHGAVIEETARLTEPFVQLPDDRKALLDEQLRLIMENLDQKPEVALTFFRPDEKKDGGTYVTVCGRVKKIDEYSRQIVLTDGTAVQIRQLFSIQGRLFGDTELSDR